MQAQQFRKSIRSTQASVLKGRMAILRSLAIRSERAIVLETNGTEFVVWRENHSRKATGTVISAIEPLNTVSFTRTLHEIEYVGESIHVILHPPVVCVRSFQPKTENSDKWLASHLVEVAPPGNRRDFVMCYRTLPLNLLIVAFARRAFLSELTQMAQQSRISLKGIYAGGSLAADSLFRLADECHQLRVDFSLCRYEVSREDEAVQIFPHANSSGIILSSASSEATTLSPQYTVTAGQLPTVSCQSIVLSAKGDTIDFASQIGLPKTLSSHIARRVLHTEFITILLLLGILLLHWGVQTADGNPVSDTNYRMVIGKLTALRQKNSLAMKEVELATGLQRPRLTACFFLRSVALATPPQVWLSSITFGTPASGAACTFALVGFSISDDGPLRLADSLRSARDIRAVTLTKVNIVEHQLLDIDLKNSLDRLTKFEIAGEYERE